jgi:hypothetical protein
MARGNVFVALPTSVEVPECPWATRWHGWQMNGLVKGVGSESRASLALTIAFFLRANCG